LALISSTVSTASKSME